MKKKILLISIALLSVVAVAGGVGFYYYYSHYQKTSSTKGLKHLSHFNDLNPIQLKSAKRHGLKKPIKDRKEAKNTTKQLVHITDNDYIKVAPLTHSVPYLTEGASTLLHTIGKNFQDSLMAKGYCKRRIVVSSLLRTENDVKRLQKVNPNATRNSAHMYATTFDITYVRFSHNPIADIFQGKVPSATIMQSILCNVLKDLKENKQCYIKYEHRQQCFHITTRI